MTARIGIERYAVRLLAQSGSTAAHDELRRLVEAIPEARQAGRLAQTSAVLHRRPVELSGNATLAMIAGTVHDISEAHTSAMLLRDQNVAPKAQYAKLVRSYGRLVDLVTDRKGAEAEAHWRRHMNSASAALRCSRVTRTPRFATSCTDVTGVSNSTPGLILLLSQVA